MKKRAKKGFELFFVVILGAFAVFMQIVIGLCIFVACNVEFEDNPETPTYSASTVYEPNEIEVTTSATTKATTTATTEDPTKKYFDRAKKYFDKQQYDEMLNELERLQKKYPDADVDEFIIEMLESVSVVTAKEIEEEYNENSVKADNKYLDKYVIVSGVVDNVGKDILDNVYVMINDGNEYSILGVQCYVADSELPNAAELKTGDKVYILGICGGQLFNISLDDCYIVTNYMK